MEHTDRLEEIDKEQREKEAQNNDVDDAKVFAETVYEAATPPKGEPAIPLLSQEEIEDEEPPRINMTAVVCTAIVAVCATIILCVAQPWKNNDEQEPVQVAQVENDDVNQVVKNTPKPNDIKPVEAVKKEEPVKKVEPAKEEPKKEPSKAAESTLPVIKVTKTGTQNPYNNVRLIDASSRLLTKNEVAQMTKQELSLARNAIYARHGYQYKNAELSEFFGRQPWFKPTDVKMEDIPFTKIELDNIRLIKAQEKN